MTPHEDEEPDAREATTLHRDRQSNRRVLAVVGLVTLVVIAWNLYVQVIAR